MNVLLNANSRTSGAGDIQDNGGKQTMKNYYNDNPLDFNTNPDPYWNAKPLYGKPDLQALYA